MYAQRFTHIFILLVLVVLALIPARAVSANPPDMGTGSLEINAPLEEPFQVCPGLEIWDDEVLTTRETDFYNNQGDLTLIKIFVKGTDNFYNPENPDVVLSGDFSGTLYFDPQTGASLGGSGLPAHITVPGYGTVLLLSGHWSSYPDMHLAGKDSFTDPKDVAALCSLLAGN